MPGLIAFYSMYVVIPLRVFSRGFWDQGGRIGSRRQPRIQPGLRAFTAIIALLAIDFAIVPRSVGLGVSISDAAAILIPLLVGMLTEPSAWDLWSICAIVGLLGVLYGLVSGGF